MRATSDRATPRYDVFQVRLFSLELRLVSRDRVRSTQDGRTRIAATRCLRPLDHHRLSAYIKPTRREDSAELWVWK